MKWIKHLIRILFLAVFIFITLKGNMVLWLVFFGISLVVALVFGRVYCGYVCPMNTVMLPVGWISKRLNIQTENTPKWMQKGILPWVFLVVSILLMILSKKLFKMNIPILLIWVGISILVTIRFKPFIFHNQICPFGALQKTFGRFAFFSENVDPETCIGCKKCEAVCPSNAIKVNKEHKAVITKMTCHQCSNCSDVCPVSAIKYSKKR